MTVLLILVLLTALVVYAIERNHRRQGANGRRFGGTDIEDRDAARARADAAAIFSRWPSADPEYRVVRRRRARARIASQRVVSVRRTAAHR